MKKKLNILYLIDNPQMYGSEIHLLDILKYMKSIHNIKLIAFQNGPLLEILDSLEISYEIILTGYLLHRSSKNKILKIIKVLNIDLIHAHQPKALYLGSFLSILSKLPLISTIHSQSKDHAIVHKGLKKNIVYLVHLHISYISQLISKKIIFVSKYMLDKSYFPKKSQLIYNWVQPELIDKINLKQFTNKINNNLRFLAVGSVTYAKGYDLLFRFFEILIQEQSLDFSVDILGGIDSKFLNEQKKIVSTDVLNRITFHGFSSQKESFYNDADIFILFSRSETFGLVYSEAMAYGLPIITGDIEVLKEIIPPQNSLSFNLRKHISYIEDVIRDNKKRENIFNINRIKVIKYFNYKQSMQLLNNQYENIFKQ